MGSLIVQTGLQSSIWVSRGTLCDTAAALQHARKATRPSKGSVTCEVALIQSTSNNHSLETHYVRRMTVRYREVSYRHDVVSTNFMVAHIAREQTSLTSRHWSSKRC